MKSMQEAKNNVTFRPALLSTLVYADWNYKENDEEMKEKLKNNILKNGFIQNLVVRKLGKKYEVVDGNHRLEALKELNYQEVMVCDVGEISDKQAYLISINLNETHFENNEWKLSTIIKSLSENYSSEQLAELLPYEQGNIESMIETAEIDWDQLRSQIPETPGEQGGYKTVMLQVKEEVFETWERWCERVKKKTDNPSKALAFEYAIIEALNTPEE